MTKIDKATARHLASLSNITLSDDDLDALTGDLEKIVEYIDDLAALDTSGVEPTYQVTGLSNIWREDEVVPQLEREKLLALAFDRTTNAMKVPKVL
ncbi:Asp-tRNA(Asn)/Glu-tRNA(Gln) amidotransferase subunit GatC [Alphaproteobacteria bacterium]|nr:Asp-tRNA(Asn)/Glu-tRNA(Gln) amidotransferase subunit GatC [Alphaproteobacteria bacterium]